MEQYRFLAACGLYCGACHHYHADVSGEENASGAAEGNAPGIEPCGGCRSDAPAAYCAR